MLVISKESNADCACYDSLQKAVEDGEEPESDEHIRDEEPTSNVSSVFDGVNLVLFVGVILNEVPHDLLDFSNRKAYHEVSQKSEKYQKAQACCYQNEQVVECQVFCK